MFEVISVVFQDAIHNLDVKYAKHTRHTVPLFTYLID